MDIRDNFYLNDNIFLDNAATTLKLKSVVEEVQKAFSTNVDIEKVRKDVASFVNVPKDSIKFVRGTTNALNLVARFLEKKITKKDTILLSVAEHHSNILPWQNISKNMKCKLKYMDISEDGKLIEEYPSNMKILSIAHVSNALGTINSIKDIAKKAKEMGAYVVIDGAQAPSHIKVDISDIDCDFYAFSGHKMYGPTGIGILYDKNNMIKENFDNDIAIAGFGKAIEFLSSNRDLFKKEQDLLSYATDKLKKVGVKIYGDNINKVPIISFNIPEIHPHDVASFLNEDKISIRAGHHCAQPLMNRLGVPATCRVSFGVYNRREDIDKFIKAIEKVKEFFDVN